MDSNIIDTLICHRLVELFMEIDPNNIKNKRYKGCLICQNKNVSNIVDPILYNCEMDLKELKLYLESRDIFVDISDLRAHTKHIYYDDTKTFRQNVNDGTAKIKVTPNRELIVEALSTIRAKKDSLIDNGRDDSVEFVKLAKLELDILSLKAKIDGELIDKTEIRRVPEFIQKIKEEIK